MRRASNARMALVLTTGGFGMLLTLRSGLSTSARDAPTRHCTAWEWPLFERLASLCRPLNAAEVSTERAAQIRAAVGAPALAWEDHYEQLAVLYRRQAAYAAQLAYVDARLDEYEE